MTSKRIRLALCFFIFFFDLSSSAEGERERSYEDSRGAQALFPAQRWRPGDASSGHLEGCCRRAAAPELCKSACGCQSNYNAVHVQERRLPSYPAFTYRVNPFFSTIITSMIDGRLALDLHKVGQVTLKGILLLLAGI